MRNAVRPLVVLAFTVVSVIALASPASAGVSYVTIDPTSGPVGASASVEVSCGYNASTWTVYFVDEPNQADTVLATSDAGGVGPFTVPVQIPANLDLGPGAPLAVQPGTYTVILSCENGEVTEQTSFTVTEPPTTTTTESTTTTTEATTTTTAVAAAVVQPRFTG